MTLKGNNNEVLRKHPGRLSITHISRPDIDTDLDVGQA